MPWTLRENKPKKIIEHLLNTNLVSSNTEMHPSVSAGPSSDIALRQCATIDRRCLAAEQSSQRDRESCKVGEEPQRDNN